MMHENTQTSKERTVHAGAAGGVRYFATDLEKRAGASFGLIGALASEYLYNGIICSRRLQTHHPCRLRIDQCL